MVMMVYQGSRAAYGYSLDSTNELFYIVFPSLETVYTDESQGSNLLNHSLQEYIVFVCIDVFSMSGCIRYPKVPNFVYLHNLLQFDTPLQQLS